MLLSLETCWEEPVALLPDIWVSLLCFLTGMMVRYYFMLHSNRDLLSAAQIIIVKTLYHQSVRPETVKLKFWFSKVYKPCVLLHLRLFLLFCFQLTGSQIQIFQTQEYDLIWSSHTQSQGKFISQNMRSETTYRFKENNPQLGIYHRKSHYYILQDKTKVQFMIQN